ncbi:hypothetical protein Kfla_3344 [Kribbella flavida DSM 17836]|uniref:Uncharacterized protein n=1 Tax=Kribbella flavida (strain DSM 17836 / JCM 10339 / NBRC 14399) TaxID=479435 RepID=D2PKT7_KRIFD|nr:hypothetical protein [Kribbella flavida]ADB32404.1 hypothetical protein Kfla_3344 [Kribbella flavida DSM 17836]
MSNHPATAIPTAATHGSDTAAALTAAVQTAGQVAAVALIVTIALALYLLSCLIWPFGKCHRCKGAGKFKSPFGNAYRHCGRCDGSGLRVRIGRHIVNRIRATRGAGTNTTSKGGRK